MYQIFYSEQLFSLSIKQFIYSYLEQDEEYTDDHDRPDKNKKNRRAQKEVSCFLSF